MSDKKANSEAPGRARPARRVGVLADLVAEARALPLPDPDWDKVDAALFERIEQEAAQGRALASRLASHKGQPWPWLLLGGVAAAAAAAVILAQPSVHPSLSSVALEAPAVEGSAGELAFQAGAGDVRVDGAKAHAGARARQGGSVETHGAKAVFESAGRVSWLMEDESKARVERVDRVGGGSSAVILALSHGAIEAQVTPVASGEAFAVDVGGVRVAVHGTHLRVARDGDHVVVDLTEGVVSIGTPPKVGSTYGTLVTAPAHVEFQLDSVRTSLVVEHDAAAIRGAVDITSPITSAPSEEAPVAMAASPAPSPPAHVEEAAPSPARSAPRHPSVAVVARNPNAETDIKKAVNACWQKYPSAPPHSNDPNAPYTATSIFTSELTLDVEDDGLVSQAPAPRFSPTLSPNVFECATAAIYKMRFVEPGRRTIQIRFQQ